MTPRLLSVGVAVVGALAVTQTAQGQAYYGYPSYPVVARTYNATVYYATATAPMVSPIPSAYPVVGAVPYPGGGAIYQVGYQTYASPAAPGLYLYSPYPTAYHFGWGYGGWGYGRGWGYWGWEW
jgi:hypothetical protein